MPSLKSDHTSSISSVNPEPKPTRLHVQSKLKTSNPSGSMASKTPALVAFEQLRNSQEEVAQAASRADQLQELINWMEEDVKRPCNLKTHHDSRCLPLHHLLQSHPAHLFCIQLRCSNVAADWGFLLGVLTSKSGCCTPQCSLYVSIWFASSSAQRCYVLRLLRFCVQSCWNVTSSILALTR